RWCSSWIPRSIRIPTCGRSRRLRCLTHSILPISRPTFRRSHRSLWQKFAERIRRGEGPMAESHAKHHDYHLVDPSPWPIVGAIATFILAVGAIRWMHGATPWVAVIGVIGVLYTMFMWWRDVIKEGDRGDHTPVVQLHLRYGMLLFIASEVMFFVA